MLLLARLILALWCVCGTLVLGDDPPGPWPTSVARAVACAGDVVVLGTDLTTAQRDEVVTRLGAPPLSQALFLSVSLADERVASAGLLPAYLLGVVAVSSARLTLRPAGAGLRVQTDHTVTFDTASVYANALLTAGVHDALVQVTAPTTGPALGTTALVGLLRAAGAACLAVPSDRAQLALREVVLTTQIGNSYGAGPAAALLWETERAALGARVREGGSLGAVVDRATSTAGMPLLPDTRATLISLLGDLVRASHRYPDLAAPVDLQVSSASLATASSPRPPSSPSPVARPRRIQGVVTTAAVARVTYVPTGGQVVRQAAGLLVTRNGRPASLADLLPGDHITLTRTAAGQPVRLDARGAPLPPVMSQGGDAVVMLHGTVRSAGRDHLTFTNSATGRDWTLSGAFGAVVTRNHHPHRSMAALRPGDGMTIVLDRRGQVRAIDARGAVAGATAPSPAARPRVAAPSSRPWFATPTSRPWFADMGGLLLACAALIVLVLLGLVGWALLWLVRLLGIGRRRLPFALVERRAGPADDAAPPASYDLRRDARVLCTDGQAGRLVHVVVLPETGALLRLIIRDRSKALHALPARVMSSASPSSVRLEADLGDLPALRRGAPSFSPRRYRALSPDQHHAGVAIESTPTSLQITVEGDAAHTR